MKTFEHSHETFLALLAEHQRALLKVCWVYGQTSHDRDDLLQEIISQLWASFARYDPSRPFMTWMYRVALNVGIDSQRRQRRLREMGSLRDIPEAKTPSSGNPDRDELRELLEGKKEDDRAILLLCLEGHSYREIGEVLGISETNVGTRLNRLKQALRQSDEDAGDVGA